MKTRKWASEFYKSFEWRSVRYDVLKRDGAKCSLCGAERSDGVKIHVDHKLPLRKYPNLALEMDNLQVLCEVCNHGKANKVDPCEELSATDVADFIFGEIMDWFSVSEEQLHSNIDELFSELEHYREHPIHGKHDVLKMLFAALYSLEESASRRFCSRAHDFYKDKESTQ